jgi:predicted dehydrogenase
MVNHRRDFLKATGSAAAAIAAAGYFDTPRAFAANETINIGCIGTGGRCQGLMRVLSSLPGVRIVAVCDVWDVNLAAGKKLADPQAATTKDFRELLDRKDIDAVVIGTPDHWHSPITIEACAAGKDVYVEKPLTHDLSEGAAVIDAQNRHQRIVQVGTQQRSMPHIQKAAELVKSGQLGDIHKVHLTWNRNQPRWMHNEGKVDPNSVDWKRFAGDRSQPFDEYRFRNWRWFWDFGGGILTDLMVHWLDVAHWLLDLDHPLSAMTVGDNFSTAGKWETPDTIQTLLHYPTCEVHFEGTFVNAHQGSKIELMGSNGTLYIDRGRYEITPERNKPLQASELILGTGPRGADGYDKPPGELLHLSNWIECIRSRQKPNATAEMGVSAAAAAHLANQAYRSNQIAHWKS